MSKSSGGDGIPVELFQVLKDDAVNEFLCVLVGQSCLTLCDPTDCSLPGSSVHGIPQARIL